MANPTPPTEFSLSAEPTIIIREAMVTEGEILQFLSCNSIHFHHVVPDFTRETWVLLSSEQTNMQRDVMLTSYENLCHVVFYCSQPIIIIKSEEVQDRMDRDIPPGFPSDRITHQTSQQANLTQNSLQPEALNIKDESTHANNPPEGSTIGEALYTEATIVQSRQMNRGGKIQSWDDSEVDPGESSLGRPQNRVKNDKRPKENNSNTNPPGMISFVTEHDRNQIRAKPYECRDCGKIFSSFSQLMEHKKYYSRNVLLQCNQCERTFMCPTALQSHLKVHTGNKQHKCNNCGKCFSTKYKLNRHFTIHTGEKPYECPTCKKTFRIIYHLKQHKVIHSEQKQYECNECGKAFHRRSNLTRHKLIHARSKKTSFQCVY
ncbi:zinc finger protein 69 homolog B-like [Thomomys bottae]